MADRKKFQALLDLLADELRERISEGGASAGDLNVARQLLKDLGIALDESPATGALAGILSPVDEGDEPDRVFNTNRKLN